MPATPTTTPAATCGGSVSDPAKPITIVVPVPAGGLVDFLARSLGQRMTEAWGQPVIIENKPGAGTIIGTDYVSKAQPDGYTLLLTQDSTFVINPFVYKKLPYDPVKGFVPISPMVSIYQALVANKDFPPNNAHELIELAKAKPGEVNYATVGIGSTNHLNMELLQELAGVKFTAVHYKGGAPAMNDVTAGHVPMMFISTTLASGPLKAGKVKLIGVGSLERDPQFPDVPPLAETVPGFEPRSWFGLYAPAGTPAAIVAKINAETQKVLNEPAFQKQVLEPRALTPMTGSPGQFAAFVAAEAKKWSEVVRAAHVRFD